MMPGVPSSAMASSGVTSSGYIFPVQGGSFSRGWGAPRAGHRHQGVDIFAPMGTPIRAPADGRIENKSGNLSGLAVRFYDSQGNKYFMGHLSAYSGANRNVKAGEIIGYVGNTGNARGTSPHVHFQYHPSGGGPVDPYNVLTNWQKGTRYQPQARTSAQGYGNPIGVFEATAYHGSEPGGGGFKTATGTNVGPGQIAVDPKVIPLGSKVYVEGYGVAIATDTGGAIKGKRIDVWKPSVPEANKWGRKQVKVWMLDGKTQVSQGNQIPQGEFNINRTGMVSTLDKEREYLRSVAKTGIARDTFLEMQDKHRQEQELRGQQQLINYQKEQERNRIREERRLASQSGLVGQRRLTRQPMRIGQSIRIGGV